MTTTSHVEALRAELSAHLSSYDGSALVRHGAEWAAVARAEPEHAAAEFGIAMTARGSGREAYVEARDVLRSALRRAQDVQRARRRLEIALRDARLNLERERVHNARISERYWIRRIIAVRRAGKDWSVSARAARADAQGTQAA